MPIFKIGILAFFFIVNWALAKYDARLLKRHKTIKHGINGAVYMLMISVPWFLCKDWVLVAALLFERLLVFNITLSVSNNETWDYVSPKPKSIIDRAAKFVFGKNGAVMYAVYFIIFSFLTYKSLSW